MQYSGDVSTVTSSFGGRLRHARLAQALTQVELAERTGLNHVTIVRLEGDQNTPNPRTVKRLSRVLKVKPEQLLGDQC